MERSIRNIVIVAIILVLVIATGWYVWSTQHSGPRIIWDNADENMITLDLVKPGVTVLPKFTVTGQARGTWYFEASFPVKLLDGTGKEIAATSAHAKGDWMTAEFVPFETTLVFIAPETSTGTLVFQKDNPSGLLEHDDSVSLPVRFNAHP